MAKPSKHSKSRLILPQPTRSVAPTADTDTGFNKIQELSNHKLIKADTEWGPIMVPANLHAIRCSFIVRRTTQWCTQTTGGGLLLPGDNKADATEKKFDLGEVVATGSECIGIKIGQIVCYQRNAAMRIPNGIREPIYWKLDETPIAIACVLDPQPMKDRVAFTQSDLRNAAN
jgi:co-chaperonin GroES (HSP10)